ncbi:MAG TPA: DUF4406 domain-containing protein [Thermoclostridium sp.]|nr:DUF4406 domain-containing protein [Thermoclostridium sp.]
MNKLIYVCSPYRGDIRTNTEQAKEYCRKIVQEGDIPLASHLLFPQFVDDSIASERERAMEMNLEIMRHCDEVHVFGHQISFGMLQEMQAAKKLRIPVVQEEVE